MHSVTPAIVRAGATQAVLIACGLLAAAVLAPALWAGEARLLEGESPERVVVQASDASVDEVLAMLGARFQFTIERGGSTAQPLRLSGRFAGTLEEVLDRLLRHQGHMIVRSEEAKAGVRRVVLLEGKADVPVAPSAPPGTQGLAGTIASVKARMQEKEAGK
jgi:hypothetical protein